MLKLELSWRGLVVILLALAGLWMLLQVLQVVILIIVAFIFMAALRL